MLPFPNKVAVVYMTGAQLLETLEAASQGLPYTAETADACASLMQVSGLTYTVDTAKAYDALEAYGDHWFTAGSVSRVRIDALNHALEGIDPALVRYHVCWGSWHGPHSTDLGFDKIVDLALSVNANGLSFEAANVRHEHEWKIWQDTPLPEGKYLIPGVVSHATNVLEHPELVADRIERFARLVGPERVVASTDCGLGGRVFPSIAWAKLVSLTEGARLASQRL